MWIFWSIFSMVGGTLWYLSPKLFPTQNVFSVIFFSGILAATFGLLASKVFHGQWVDPNALKLGIANAIGGAMMTTLGLVLALNAGGKLGAVSVIIEFCLVLVALSSVFFFKEHLNVWQIIGIVLAISGIVLVLAFEK